MEEAVAKKSKSKIIKRILSILGWSLIGLLFLYSSLGVIDRATDYKVPFFGLRNYTILSESMSYDKYGDASQYEVHQLQVDDLVITYTSSYDDIHVGDVITYRSNNGIISHRVVEKYQTDNYRYLVTRGDANSSTDGPIEYGKVTGKVVGVVSKVGVVVKFIQSPYFLIACGFSGFLIFGGIFVYQYTEDKKKEKNKDKEKPNDLS